jgi:Putative Flp pilus-assembly TadE/G-like
MSRHQTGQVSIFVLGVALVCFAVAGVAVDGTRAFLHRRTLQNAADAAALAGAGEIDVASVYSGDEATRLDEASARVAALEWLERRGLAVQAEVSVSESLVRVALQARMDTTFLGLVGVADLPVAAAADAEPVVRSP